MEENGDKIDGEKKWRDTIRYLQNKSKEDNNKKNNKIYKKILITKIYKQQHVQCNTKYKEWLTSSK